MDRPLERVLVVVCCGFAVVIDGCCCCCHTSKFRYFHELALPDRLDGAMTTWAQRRADGSMYCFDRDKERDAGDRSGKGKSMQ
jgi:hypothetical protein